ncbi:diguanylate cyclase [Gordonia sp. UCD-TK1]|uniref:GGDEF domain-containing protein n=1 Tax=Gordonia sp. UCD-TK1 TaxID=1857893 RepID=UPI0020C7CC72|nr:GGDEF domain-containing protein [Gordonia sp. UCD-TK1]
MAIEHRQRGDHEERPAARFRALRHGPATDEISGHHHLFYDNADHVLKQVRMREWHVRVTIAVLVAVCGALGTIALFTPSGTQGSVPRSIALGIVAATTIPMAFVVSRVHLGVIWWTKQSSIRGFNTLFVLWADAVLTVAILAISDIILAQFCALIFAVIGSYVAHFVRSPVAYAHMIYSSIAVCAMGLMSWADGTPVLNVLFTTLALLVVTNGTTALHRSYTSDFQRSLKHQLIMANTDSLTGLLNRRGFIYATTTMLRRSPAQPFALVTADVDRFKAINDEHGHATGDDVLERVAAILQGATDEQAIVARLGGDEFAIATLADETSVRALAERIRARRITIPGGATATMSLGIAVGATPGGHMSADDADAFIRHEFDVADHALFDAKAAGRDTYVVAGRTAASRSTGGRPATTARPGSADRRGREPA